MAAELADSQAKRRTLGFAARHYSCHFVPYTGIASQRCRSQTAGTGACAIGRAKSSDEVSAEADPRPETLLPKSLGAVLHGTVLHWLYSALAREDLGYELCIQRAPSHVRYFCPKRFNHIWNATHGTATNGLRRKGVKSKSKRVNRSCSGTAIGASVPSSRTSHPANDMRFTYQCSAFGDFLI